MFINQTEWGPMGSHAYIAVDGYPIESTNNDFYQWYFKKSDRRIVQRKVSERNQLFWATPDPDIADEIEEAYIFEASARSPPVGKLGRSTIPTTSATPKSASAMLAACLNPGASLSASTTTFLPLKCSA